jgi:hypothetical protein
MFVEKAKALEPRYLAMIIPARWFAGGKGLDEFRENMLADTRVRSIDDFPQCIGCAFRASKIEGWRLLLPLEPRPSGAVRR